MSVSPREFIKQFRAEHPDKQLTYQKILDGTGRTDLQNADLRNTNLRGADFRGANLCGANLRYVNLWCASLQNTNLRDADLRGANLWDVDLRCANLENAKLWGANLWDDIILLLRGLPSGELILYPTPGGWVLRVGCWQGTPEELKTLVAGDKWPETKDEEEIVTRRVLFEGIYPLLDHHIAQNYGVIEELAEKWNT